MEYKKERTFANGEGNLKFQNYIKSKIARRPFVGVRSSELSLVGLSKKIGSTKIK